MRHAGLPGGGLALLFVAGLIAACGGTPTSPSDDCRRPCPEGTRCERGECVAPPCPDGQLDCNGIVSDGCEVTPGTDVGNCGACGTTCTADHGTPACVDGACVLDGCDDGFADCDGDATTDCEQDTAGDVGHCGACDAPCPTGPQATATCAGGTCGLDCQEGFADCDGDATTGCEVEPATDVAHCGACGEPCATGETCEAGQCVPTTVTCTPPTADCNQIPTDGCEVDTSTDAAHCGACGEVCPAGAVCSGGTCTYACMTEQPDPVTGQKCPIATACTEYAQCGTQLGAPQWKYWYCSPTLGTCQYLPQSGGFTAAPGTCTGALVFRQLSGAPWDKRILPPDGVAFRAGTTLALEVTNTTAADLYLDQLPLTLELAGQNPSPFDVNSIHLYQVGNIADYGDGNNATQFVCSSPQTPFGASTTFTLGTGATGGCGGSFFSRVRAGQSQRFVINLAFAAGTTFIEGRHYRLRIGAPLTGVRARPSTTGASAATTACTLPAAGITGAYLKFQDP